MILNTIFIDQPNYSKVSGCVDENGRIVAWDHKIAVPSIWERVNPSLMRNGIDRAAVEGLENLPYDVPHLLVEFVKVDLPIPVGFWRSVGSSHNAFTVESFIDELAYIAKKILWSSEYPTCQSIKELLDYWVLLQITLAGTIKKLVMVMV